MDNEDKKILEHYNRMPWAGSKPITGGMGSFLIPIVFISMVIGIAMLVSSNVENQKQEIAQDIYDVQTGDFTCGELEMKLKRVFFASHYLLKKSIEKKLIGDGCISQYDLQERRDIEYCLKHDTVTCRVDALKNPEKYETREPFNTRTR